MERKSVTPWDKVEPPELEQALFNLLQAVASCEGALPGRDLETPVQGKKREEKKP